MTNIQNIFTYVLQDRINDERKVLNSYRAVKTQKLKKFHYFHFYLEIY